MPIEVDGKQSNDYVKLTGLKARAVFRVLTPPLRAKTSDGFIDRPQTSCSFPATYTRQKQDGSHETVTYYKNKTLKLKGQNQFTEFTPDFVTIESGEINLSTVTDKDLYYFLQNHPHNKSNPVYDKDAPGANSDKIDQLIMNRNVPFEFYELDVRKAAKKNLETERKIEAAKSMVLAQNGSEDYLDNKQIVLLCRAYSMAETDDCVMVDDYDTLRSALLDQIKLDPSEFMRKVDNAALGLEAMIADAVRLSVVKYDQPAAEDGGWYWNQTKKPIEPKKICSVSAARFSEKETILVDFLRTDAGGVSISKRMKEEVDAARRVAVAK